MVVQINAEHSYHLNFKTQKLIQTQVSHTKSKSFNLPIFGPPLWILLIWIPLIWIPLVWTPLVLIPLVWVPPIWVTTVCIPLSGHPWSGYPWHLVTVTTQENATENKAWSVYSRANH